MKFGFDQNGKQVTMVEVGEVEGIGNLIGRIVLFLVGFAAILLVFALLFVFLVVADAYIFDVIGKVFLLKIWLFPAEFDHWIGIWDHHLQQSVFVIAIITLITLIIYRIWNKQIRPGVVKTIGKLWIGSNLAILFFRLPLYILLSAYIAFVGMDDFHLYDSREIEYVARDDGFYANHGDAAIDSYHSEPFDSETVKDINGTEYDDYIMVTSGNRPNSEESGYWVDIRLNLDGKVNDLMFTGAFLEKMEISKDNPVMVKIQTDRETDKEKVVTEKVLTDINQIEHFESNVNGARTVDIIISSNHEFNFGLFEMKKYMMDE